MGADLYIRSIADKIRAEYEPVFEKAVAERDAAKSTGNGIREAQAQKRVSEAYEKMNDGLGYYRDNYNSGGLSSIMGFSWWQDVIPLLDDEGLLQPKQIKVFLSILKKCPEINVTAEYLKAKNCKVDDGACSPEAWTLSKREQRDELFDFLARALSLNEAIDCSL